MRGSAMLADVARRRDVRKRLPNGGGASRWPWRPPDGSRAGEDAAEDERMGAAADVYSFDRSRTDARKPQDLERQQMSRSYERREPQQSRVEDQRAAAESLWQEFFADPSQWWDHRYAKGNPRYPDFKHKTTKDALWLNSDFNPPWVEKELSLLPPGAVQMNLFSWNAMLVKHMKSGQPEKTLDVYHQMERESITPDRFSFVPALNACASLREPLEGRRIHRRVVRSRCDSNVFVANSLIDMYSKCNCFEEAWAVFRDMPKRDLVSFNTMIKTCVRGGNGPKALELFAKMQKVEIDPDIFTFVGVLNACAISRALDEGKRLHKQIIESGDESNVYVGTSLVDMYVECGSMEDACTVFERMPERSVVSWNVMILGRVKNREGLKALRLYRQMQDEGVDPDSVTFVGVLNACASVRDIGEGRNVHEAVKRRNLEGDFYVGSSLVDMYAKSGSIEEAWKAFNEMRTRDVISYNTMILGHVQHGQGWKALELYEQLQLQGMEPDHVTFIGALNACASVRALEDGKRIHEHVVQGGFESDIFVGNSLVDMYAKCGSLGEAWDVFKRLPERDVVTWNSMIFGLTKCGQGQEALNLYKEIREGGVNPISATFVGAANACASLGALAEGHLVHEDVIKSGCEADPYLRSSLIDMYAKCGSIQDAWRVFRANPSASQDVVLWNAMLQGCVRCGQAWEAFELFQEMQDAGVKPGPLTFVPMLNACASAGDLEQGKRIHEQVTSLRFESDLFVGSSLVDMYSKCGSVEDARRVFNEMPSRDVVCWNAMLSGYLKCGRGKEAMELFHDMLESDIEPGPATFVAMLKACACSEALDEGKGVHDLTVKSGCETHPEVSSSLMDMYAKCKSIEDAAQVFERRSSRDVKSWNAIILGHVRCGQYQKALDLYRRRTEEEFEPDPSLFPWMLKACASLGDLDEGRLVHEHVVKSGCKVDLSLQRDLLEMYVGCGSMDDARNVFDRMPYKDGSSWNGITGGYVVNGRHKDALALFNQMCLEGVGVSAGTYKCLLEACTQGLLVDDGLEVFRSMLSVSDADVSVGHYLCVIKLLGSVGRVMEAVDLIEKRHVSRTSSVVWNALLDHSKTHGNREVEDLVNQRLLEMNHF